MEKVMKKNPLYFCLFLLPTLLAFLIGFVIPFGMGIYMSFFKFNTIDNMEWVGLDNFVQIFTGDEKEVGIVANSFWFTALFAILSTIAINVIAFMVAVLLTRNFGGTNLFRTIFFMPNLLGGVLLGTIWKILLNGVLVGMKQTLTTNGTNGFIFTSRVYRAFPTTSRKPRESTAPTISRFSSRSPFRLSCRPSACVHSSPSPTASNCLTRT